MLVDGRGTPLPPPKRPRMSAIFEVLISWFKKKRRLTIASLVGITALITFSLRMYDRFSKGPSFDIPVQVSNNTNVPIEIAALLDFYITTTPFYSGRLMAGESPTGRIKLKTTGTDGKSPYNIEPGEFKTYVATFQQSPYKSELASGGSNIEFVLRLEDANTTPPWIERVFHPDVLKSTTLSFSIK